ncbi:MAG: hypothetical protein HZR80_12205 [Candidatus Heimdallarchaeota archaeon]
MIKAIKMSVPDYKIINITEQNLDEYDLLCHKSKKSGEGYQNKVKWFMDRLKEGLKLKLLLIDEGTRGFRSRGFIEYIPGEYTWRGIDAKGYMVIHCIWVIGKNKKMGFGVKLLNKCLIDAQGMYGVVVVTSKTGWLPKSKFFIKNSFEKVDGLPPSFDLYVKKFSEVFPNPAFYPISRKEEFSDGLAIMISHQCPYSPSAKNVVQRVAKKLNLPFRVIEITDCKQAQRNGIHPYGTYCVVLNGEALTYRASSEKDILELIKKKEVKIE